ncbi:hypothetical protein Ahy_B04g072201 [Arachis hypogaea]|uniref:CCHC-type domain-containing protein n=1 Tax=Arachis hypogaea TaxID=3818 RepID=A0A444ZMU1_ARAHY|nr:hypothetical protein Ahy_B04g072201 [Arachis hypogaea]
MKISQRNIGARRKALKENKKATDGSSTIKPSMDVQKIVKTKTNGATGSGSKFACPNKSRAAVAARPNIGAPKNARQKGLPCVHALAAKARRGDRPETYVHPLLKIGAAIATYQHCIQPKKTNYLKPILPKLKRPVGRPVKRRRKESSETEVSRTDGNKVKRTFRVTCSKCGEVGHNYKTCKGPPAATTRCPTNPNRRKTKAGANPGTSNQPAEEIHFSQSAPQVQNMVDHPNAPGFVSSMKNSRVTILQSARAKQPIIRPQYPAPVQSSTPPPIPPPRPSQGVSAETIAAVSKGTTSRMFQFIPNPGFKHPRQKLLMSPSPIPLQLWPPPSLPPWRFEDDELPLLGIIAAANKPGFQKIQ